MKTRTGTDETLRCSFCHKSQDAVAKLISSPSDYPRAYICDECVAVCNSILEDDRAETQPGRGACPPAQAAGGQGVPGRVRHRPGDDQEEARGRGLQPLQARADEPHARQRCRAVEVEHPAGGPDGQRQDAAGPHPGQDAGCALRHRGRHHADRGRLRRRGCGEHHPQAAAGRRWRRDAGRRPASSTSTRSTRSAARTRTRRSRAMSPARACSRRCSRSSKARWPMFRRRAAASIRTRSSPRSTPPTSCSSAAAPLSAWSAWSDAAWARRRWASRR